MTGHAPSSPPTPARVVGIGSTIAAMVAVILAVGPRLVPAEREPSFPPALPDTTPGQPIPAEAGVFRLKPGDLAAPLSSPRRPDAHPRTLAFYRSGRAYPGAPPPIPHGLTAGEFRTGGCNTCHERGGYVVRFGAYAPVTPHPEYTNCLQCHVPRDVLVGAPLPTDPESDAVCLQCHLPEGETPALVPLDWKPAPWPQTGRTALEGSPPTIPHDLQLRGNCLACHAGPAAVKEIRTTHPERANCRQCHVPAAPDEGGFSRPGEDGGPAGDRTS